ncbi:FecR family protein [Mucilaginibacter terrenus]|uniref:FecR family protein n=1 Tax=Mucilaginibacter terrenus TaxID=2482727 RepID=A0A3E2NTC0_9SPHI|nr:FecR domain-containing protein [Mucilaginibacter terrenus]RFZ84171.1 FecR family protein [Mucilaginibacter terrenus]
MEETYHLLITAYYEKTISDDELTLLKEWIDASEENLVQFSETIGILEASQAYFAKPLNNNQVWAKVEAHISAQPGIKSKTLNTKWYAAAAACILLCALAWSARGVLQQFNKSEYVTITNVDGKHSKVLLPDRSTVILSGGTILKYNKNFGADGRNIMLDGEAFFDVVHQSGKPFVVFTGDISTVVLGTSFNVKAYSSQKEVAVTVSSGKVGVLSGSNQNNHLVRYLVRNEQLNINTQTGLYTFNNADAGAVSAWVNNNLSFYNTNFSDIAASLEHHYGVKIFLTDAELGDIKLTAKLKNLTINRAMDDLCSLAGLGYTIKGNQVFVSHGDQKGGRLMR